MVYLLSIKAVNDTPSTINEMNLRDLKYIVTTAETGNFSKASELCNISQPTLSMQIKKLEDYLGVEIFERQGKNFLITKAGEEIISKAKEILLLESEIKNIAKSYKQNQIKELHIGAFPTLAAYYFPKIIPKINQAFPQIKLFLYEEKTDFLIEKIENGKLDFAFLALPINSEKIGFKTLFFEKFLVATSKQNNSFNKSKKNKFVSLEDLSSQNLLLLEEGHCLRKQALEVCAINNLSENNSFRATSLETLRQMVAINLGVTLIPEIARKNDDNISYFELSKEVKAGREIALCYRKNSIFEKFAEKMIGINSMIDNYS
ncbi:MAG: LysR substrate-binding domain-containing protein [Rickettsiales bacterium]|nr:LysR substrate-binding domain-containing protein [Rickettsiales bacterium]